VDSGSGSLPRKKLLGAEIVEVSSDCQAQKRTDYFNRKMTVAFGKRRSNSEALSVISPQDIAKDRFRKGSKRTARFLTLPHCCEIITFVARASVKLLYSKSSRMANWLSLRAQAAGIKEPTAKLLDAIEACLRPGSRTDEKGAQVRCLSQDHRGPWQCVKYISALRAGTASEHLGRGNSS
jgi:hypothetical protein